MSYHGRRRAAEHEHMWSFPMWRRWRNGPLAGTLIRMSTPSPERATNLWLEVYR